MIFGKESISLHPLSSDSALEFDFTFLTANYTEHGHWAAVLHLNFQAGSTFPVPVCTVLLGHWVNKAHSIGLAGAVRLTRSDFRLNLL